MTESRPAFGILGPLQLRVDGVVVPLGTPKQRAVLAMLLMNRNRPVAVDSLLAAPWVDTPPQGARSNIHSYVSNLRGLLNGVGVDGKAVLLKIPPGYAINVDDCDVDHGRFVTSKNSGVHAAAAGLFEDASRHLSDALAEWRGPVLEDLRDFPFFDAFAAAVLEEKLQAHVARAEAEMACGRAEAMIGELERLAAEHPFREPLWAQLITAYYLSGRQSDALDAYRRLQATLAEELGIDPNPELQNLNGKVLRQEALDVARSAQAIAVETMASSVQRITVGSGSELVARLHSTAGESFSLTGASTSIGRLSNNDIVLTDAKVSRRHAIILNTGISFVIHDTGSANGVELQGQRIVGSATIKHGDQLRIGNSEFIFQLDAETTGETSHP